MAVRNGRLRALWVVGCLGVVTACGSVGSKDASSSPSVSTSAAAEAANIPLKTTAPVTAVPAVPSQLLDDCVDFVQFGAWTGNAPLVQMWNDAAQDFSTLRANCDALGRTNLAALQDLSAQWADVKTYLAASQTTTVATPPPPPPTAAPTPLPPPAPAPVFQQPSCGDGSYVNVDGICVSGPVAAPSPPAGATAQCNDGTYSFSQHRSGTCSHHGGVAIWL